MSKCHNYRVAVEVVVVKGGRVLLMKRASGCLVAPNAWCVSAGKVKYEEIPVDACLREAREEMQLDVEIIKEIGVRAFKGFDSKGEATYRLVYTYLVKSSDEEKEPVINEEHSEFRWVSKEELDDEKFDSISPKLKQLIKNTLNSSVIK